MNLIPQSVRDGFGKLIDPLAALFIRLHVRPNSSPPSVPRDHRVGDGVRPGVGSLWRFPAARVRHLRYVDGRVARRADMSTTFGAFYDSTLDRVGESVLFSGIAVYFLRGGVPPERLALAVVACLIALAASLIVSYTRARAEGLGLTAKVGISAAGRARAAAGAPTLFFGPGNHGSLLFWIVVVLALATSLTVVQRVRYVARATGKASARGPSRQRDTLPGHAPALQSRKGP